MEAYLDWYTQLRAHLSQEDIDTLEHRRLVRGEVKLWTPDPLEYDESGVVRYPRIPLHIRINETSRLRAYLFPLNRRIDQPPRRLVVHISQLQLGKIKLGQFAYAGTPDTEIRQYFISRDDVL